MKTLQSTLQLENAHVNSIWSTTWTQGDLVTGSLDGVVKMWSVNYETGLSERFVSNPHVTGCASVAAAKDGSVVVACYQDSIMKFFNPALGQEIAVIDPGLFQATAISLSPADDVLVAGTNIGAINVWSMQEGHELVTTLETQSKQVLSTKFSMDGKLACSSIDGFVSIFDMSKQSLIHKLEAHALPIRSVSFSPNGNLLYTASDDRHVSVYDIQSGKLINSFSHSGSAFSIDTSLDRRHFVVGCADFSVSLWDLGMQKRLDRVETHKDHVWSVAYDPSDNRGKRFASVGDDARIQLYE